MLMLTLVDGNCAILYDLDFCDQVAYSVPANPQNSTAALASYYDNNTASIYQIFGNVLAQTACNTTSSAQYSLARSCDDCAQAYKAWLCAVSIPRCTDFSSNLPWLQPRAMIQSFANGTMLDPALVAYGNQSTATSGSRNTTIDTYIVPGPYKEILPCDELCYSIVQSCPSWMSFECPTPYHSPLYFNTSYGVKPITGWDVNGRNTNITCNYPGAVYFVSTGSLALPSPIWTILSLVVVGVLLI